MLRCPICSRELKQEERIFKCENNHCFDIAREGYVNLLSGSKSGDSTGDNKEMARCRREFLEKGFYAPLAQAVGECVQRYSREGDSVLDICCGEGYYTDFLTKKYPRCYYGFDLSKNMIRLAGKRKCGGVFFVANIASIPMWSGSVNFAFHLFAPFHNEEFCRVLSSDGVLVTAIPGKEHLYGLKEVLYDNPYHNDEKEPHTEGMKLLEKIRVKSTLNLNSKEDIQALFQMTPYYYHTPSEGMRRLQERDNLTTDIEFVLLVYKKM